MVDTLSDELPTGIVAVICGTAAGNTSATVGSYYADPSNCFWKVLHQVHLSPHEIKSRDFASLSGFGIGLTDLAKVHSGRDHELPAECYDVPRFRQTIIKCKPSIVGFNGKGAARGFYGLGPRDSIEYGPQPHSADFPLVLFCPQHRALQRLLGI